MAGLGEGRMVGNAALQSQPAKPAVCQVEIDLLAQPPLGADAEAVTHNQYADHQFRIDRGATDCAVERRQLLPQRAEVEKPVDLAQQVIDWNPILKAKLIKQLRPILALLPHHRRCPKSRPGKRNHGRLPSSSPLFQQNPFAVGTTVAGRPPHRSGRAGFPHPAPTSGV